MRKTLAASGLVALCFALASVPALAQSDDAFARVPTQEIAGKQIGWVVNRTLDAMVQAVETTRVLVVVFGDTSSPLTQKFAQYVTPCPQLNQLAGAVVFAYGSPPVDEYARRMASRLKLSVYPTISLIAPRTDRLTELYRMEGFFDAESVADHLVRVVAGEKLWPKGLAVPGKLPGHYLAYPGKACTPEGAKRLGIVADAAPR
jgi:hypothetical protein